MKNKEKWKAVPGYEGLYEASTAGRVRALEKTAWIERKDGARFYRTYKQRVLKGPVNACGYARCRIRKDGVLWSTLTHIVIATTFHGPKPTDDHEVNHINGDRLDNRPVNLEWLTHGDNVQYSKHVLDNYPVGEDHFCSVLTEAEVIEILRSDIPRPVLADRYGVSVGAIQQIQHGKTWKHLGIKPVRKVRPKLTEAQVVEIYKAEGTWASVARKHDVGDSTVGRIRNGQAWAHITADLRGAP